MEIENKMKYAGLFSRFLAFSIDLIILLIPIQIFFYWTDFDHSMVKILESIVWLFYASFSISKYGSTIGQKIIGLSVEHIDRTLLTFNEALLKHGLIIIYVFLITQAMGLVEEAAYIYGDIVNLLIFVLLIPMLMVFFNDYKQTFYDVLSKSVVVDLVTFQKSFLRKSIRIIALVGSILLFGYSAVYVSIMYIASGGHGFVDNTPTTKLSKTVDYNNTKIDFYQEELDNATAMFIEADSMYDILQGDVRRDLALNCIQLFIQQEGNDDWLSEGSRYRSNAHNRYAVTEDLVIKAKKNERYMGHHFYEYDLNDVRHMEEEIADMWDLNGSQETCQKKLSTAKMYDLFILKYIKNREEAKANYENDLKYEKERDQQKFLKASLEKMASWLEVLYVKHPEYQDYAKVEKQKLEAQKKKYNQPVIKVEDSVL